MKFLKKISHKTSAKWLIAGVVIIVAGALIYFMFIQICNKSGVGSEAFLQATSSVEYLGFNFFKDGNRIYKLVGNEESEIGALYGKFVKPISESYVISGSEVYNVTNYHEGLAHKIVGADPDSFHLLKFKGKINNAYTADKSHIYIYGNIIESADLNSFEIIESVWNDVGACGFALAKDKYSAFLNGIKLPGVNPVSFESISSGTYGGGCASGIYTRDDRSVFYNFNKIEQADPGTFEYVGGDSYAQDVSFFYNEGKIVSDNPTKMREELRQAGAFIPAKM